MAVIDLSGIPITYPTPTDGANTSDPIISYASGDQYAVTLTLTTRSDAFSLNAAITRLADQACKQISLSEKQARFLDKETREREVVGIMQCHYAHTLLQWVEEGDLRPFGDNASSQLPDRKTA